MQSVAGEQTAAAEAGGAVQVEADQIQLFEAQVVPAGPSHVPPKHLLLAPHHPHPVAPAQSPQLEIDSHLPHVLDAPNCQS